VKAQRTGEEEKIVLPEHCPSCASVLERKVGEVALMCPNTIDCIAQRKEQLRHFVSKYCVNITGLGSALIDMLVEQKLIMHWPDIWDLITSEKLVQLRRLPGIADKKIYQLTQEI